MNRPNMLNFTLTSTGHKKQCILTGPMGDILSVEFINRRSASLFAQGKADGYPATLWLVNERGAHEGYRNIPPPPGITPKSGVQQETSVHPAYQEVPFSMLTLIHHQQRKQGAGNGKDSGPRGPRMPS